MAGIRIEIPFADECLSRPTLVRRVLIPTIVGFTTLCLLRFALSWAAADRYSEASGRRLTFGYVLLGELNDSRADAERLARLLGGRAALVNVIPYNPVAGMPWKEPARQAVERFLDVLTTAIRHWWATTSARGR